MSTQKHNDTRSWQLGPFEITLSVNHFSDIAHLRLFFYAKGWVIRVGEVMMFKRNGR